MTSRISSSEKGLLDIGLTRQVIKRHIWLPVLALIGFILALPVVTAIACDNLSDEWLDQRVANLLEDIFTIQQFLVSSIIMVGAVMAAATMFRYLHVRRQIDFYHSLPVRREKFFVCNVLAGLLVFLLPYLTGVLLNVLMLAVNGLMPYVSPGDMLQWVAFNVLAYMLFFACTTFAMMLSGTLPSALKVLTCIFFLAPVAGLVLEGLGSIFFDRWLSMSVPLNQILMRASVVVRYVMLSDGSIFTGSDGPWLPLWQDWLAAALLTVALLAISLLLYKKRASECAASTLAFGWQKLPYKYPVVVLGGLGLAMFFYAVGNMNTVWLYFGGVFGACFMAMLLEILIQNDFRAVRQGWKGAVAATVIVCTVLSVYVCDAMGYDDRLPAAEKIQSVSIYSNVINNATGGYAYGSYRNNRENRDTYWNVEPEFGYDMRTFSRPEEIAAVLELVNIGMEYENNLFDPYKEVNDTDRPQDDRLLTAGYDENTDFMRVVYHLNGGSYMARVYHNIPVAECYDEYVTLLYSDVIDETLPINNYDLNGVYTREIYNFGVNDTNRYWEVKWPSDEARLQFVETLRREQMALSPQEMLWEYPIARIELMYGEGANQDDDSDHIWYDYTDYFEVKIYPGMIETRELLRTVVPDIFFRPVGLEHVTEVREYVFVGYDAKYTEDTNVYLKGDVYVETSSYSDGYIRQAVYLPGRDDAKIAGILEATIQEEMRGRLPLYSPYEAAGTICYEVDYAMGDPASEQGQTVATQRRWLKLPQEPKTELQ